MLVLGLGLAKQSQAKQSKAGGGGTDDGMVHA